MVLRGFFIKVGANRGETGTENKAYLGIVRHGFASYSQSASVQALV